jgi:glycosyltransferase involved in cell wall biosynthesis
MRRSGPNVIERPTLLIIGPTPPPYHGVAVATRALLDRGLGSGFRLRHLDLADRRGIQHVDRPDLHDVWLFAAQWFRLLVLLSRERVHLVYIPLSQTTIGVLRDSLLMWPAYLLGARVIFHLHGGQFRAWYDASPRPLRAYARVVLRRASRVIVLGESLRPVFDGLVDPKRIEVVPNGVADLGRRGARGVSGRYRVLHVGTLSLAKGALELLGAAARVVASRGDVEFVLAGPWLREEDRREAEAVVARSGLASHVTYPGQVDRARKAELLVSADVFVFPGLQQEGQPLVVLEAMAAGLPVVFTDRGCLRETVVEGATGCVVKTGDAADLARVLLRLINHPEEGRGLGAAGRRRYEALYTLDRFVARMAGVFARAVQEGR